METKEWMEAFGEIQDKYLEEALQAGKKEKKKRMNWWMRWASVAAGACILAAAIAGGVLRGTGRGSGNREKPDSDFAAVDSVNTTKAADQQMEEVVPEAAQEPTGQPAPETAPPVMESDVLLPTEAMIQQRTEPTGQPALETAPPVMESDVLLPTEAMIQQRTESAPAEELPVLIFGDTPLSDGLADIALPDGYFFHDMDEEEMASIWGQETLTWEGLGITDRYTLLGQIIYDGTGTVWKATVSGYKKEDPDPERDMSFFSIDMSPGQLPPECIVYETEKTSCEIWGTDVDAFSCEGSCYPDGVTETLYTHYEVRFVRQSEETVGVKIELRAPEGQEEEAEDLLRRLVSQSLRPEEILRLSQLMTEDIPEWRSERLTEEEAALETGFTDYLPEALPKRLAFGSAWRELGQGRNYLFIEYRDTTAGQETEGYVSWSIEKAEKTPQTVDIFNPESYSWNEYRSIQDIPEQYWDSMMEPMFAARDLSLDLLKARERDSESSGKNPIICLAAVYPDNTIVRINGCLSAEEAGLMMGLIERGIELPVGEAAADEPTAEGVPEEDTDHKDNAALMTDFAVRLFQSSLEEGENTLISPLSAAAALGMTANGAKQETLKEMEAVIGMPLDKMNIYFSSLMNRMSSEEKSRMTAVNSIWTKEGFDAKEDFLETVQSLFDAELFHVSFDETTLDAINAWISGRTDGMIEKLLDEISEDAVMYLINAIAFDAEWEDIYRETQVRKEIFTGEEGQQQTVEMMYSEESRYLEDADACGFIKYYAGRKYAFAALLPDEGVQASDYAASLTGMRLYEILSGAQPVLVDVGIPKFEVEYGMEMNDALKRIGMRSAFDRLTADFSGIGTPPEGSLYINRVLYKTHLAVDEKGTKAGAATAVEMVTECAAVPVGEKKAVYLNRPFVYMLIDCESSVPAFIGIMENPEKE